MIDKMTKSDTERAERKWANEQALASAKIEGYVPSVDFLADSADIVEGNITLEEALQRSRARALAAVKAAASSKV